MLGNRAGLCESVSPRPRASRPCRNSRGALNSHYVVSQADGFRIRRRSDVSMPSFFDFLPLLAAQQGGRQRLARKPEPEQLTEAVDNVVQYDQVMQTKLAVLYAVGLELIHRTRSDADNASAIDLACGPGHFTLCLSRYLGYSSVLGIDLSSPMIETARRNASQTGLEDGVAFQVGDVTQLTHIESDSSHLTCFTDAAHHMPDLQTVEQVLREMNRITQPDGSIMLMDLSRLRTAELTERYCKTLAQDYVDRGLPQFFDDFRNSMFAAWTASELRAAIPTDTNRCWCHLVPRGLPTVQIILGLPVGQNRIFQRPGFPQGRHPLLREWLPVWEREVGPKWAKETQQEFNMLRMTLRFGSRQMIRP